LIVAEIALAFALVLTVGLLGKSYWRLMEVNPGYDPRNVLTMSLLPASSRYDTFDKRLRYFEAVAQRVRSVAGVERVGYASTIPLSNPESHRFYVRERAASGGEAPHLDTYYVSAEYFAAMKIPLLRGRLIDERDRRRLAPVAVVSESCARTQFKGEDPIGQHVQVDARDEQAPWATIVGIVGDVHQYGLETAPDAAVYLAFVQAEEPQGFGRLIVRCAVDPERMRAAVTGAMRSVDPTQVIFHVQPMDAYIAKSVAQRTFVLALIGTFGGLALLLAMVGIYGVISYSVVMRTREVGIRMALGADAGDVILMILRQVFGTALAGLGIGLCGSLLCSGALSSLLFGVKPTDAATISGVATATLRGGACRQLRSSSEGGPVGAGMGFASRISSISSPAACYCARPGQSQGNGFYPTNGSCGPRLSLKVPRFKGIQRIAVVTHRVTNIQADWSSCRLLTRTAR